MQNGQQTATQKSRLSTKLAQMQDEQADLMASHMSSFVQSSQDMLNAAQRTIESDLEELSESTRSITASRTRWMHQRLRLAPWALLSVSLLSMAALIGASLALIWQAERMQMTRFGLSQATILDQTYLVLDPNQIRVGTCTIAGRAVTCLKVQN